MARRQTRESVLVGLANSSKHVKGGTGVNSEKYKRCFDFIWWCCPASAFVWAVLGKHFG
jgi:hypothetical protein